MRNIQVIWLTGLSGAGKTTLSNTLSQILNTKGIKCIRLDGDEVRSGLNNNLGFDLNDRYENIRRIAELAKLLIRQGFPVIISVISPLESDRKVAFDILGRDQIVLIYLKCPINVCEARDVKGLYAKARNGKIVNFTGISSQYEEPINPDLTIDTSLLKISETHTLLENFFLK